jgi:hypothetical protein
MLPTVALENAMACRVFRHLKSVMRTESPSPANVVRPPPIPLANRAGLSTSDIPHPPAGALAPQFCAPALVASDSRSSNDDVSDVTFPQSAKLSPMRVV